MQGYQRVLQPRQRGDLAVPDGGAYQFRGGPAERQVRLVGNGRPVRMAAARPPVPPGGHLGEPAPRHVEPLDRARPGGRHADVEDPGEGRLAREERQERAERRAQHLLVGGALGQRLRRGDHPADHELAAFPGRVEEAVLLVREVRVEGGPGHPGPAHDIGDRDVGVAGLGDRRDHRRAQPLQLGCPDVRRRKPAAAPGQAGLTLVRFGEATPLHGPGQVRTSWLTWRGKGSR